MGAVDLDEAADLLYALPAAQFTARRGELAAQARTSGSTAVAKQIAELRRPTVSAGLINRLVRAAPDAELVERIGTLGDSLRQAQAALDGPAMKELTQERHELVAALVRRTAELVDGDQKLSGAVQRELEETFGAAVADEQAALAVTSGRLTRALVYAGFGEVDVTAATATPLRRGPRPSRSPAGAPGNGAEDRHLSAVADSGPAGPKPAARTTTSRSTVGTLSPAEVHAAAEAAAEAESARLREAASSAQEALREYQDQLAASSQRRDEVRAHEAELATRLDDLQREILRIRHELDAASRQVATAERDQQRHERQVRDARRAAERADRAVARHNDPASTG